MRSIKNLIFFAMNNKLVFSLVFIFGSIAGQAQAACTNFISSVTLNVGTITIQRDSPIGSPVSAKIYGVNQTVSQCDDPSGKGVANGVYSSLPVNSITSAGAAVFNTSLQGVGVSVGVNGGLYAGQWDVAIEAGVTKEPMGGVTGSAPHSWDYMPFATFIKTSDLAQSGMLNQQIAYYQPYYGSSFGQYGTGTPGTPIPVYITGTVNVVACSITTPNLTFPIGNVSASTFGSSIGYTPTDAVNSQNLGLDCKAGANINVSLSGTQNPDVGTTSVLALTGQGSAGVASGVGVQILYNGLPLELNNRIVLKQANGAQETFPLIARYYQTKPAVTTGTANASATLNLTYQ